MNSQADCFRLVFLSLLAIALLCLLVSVYLTSRPDSPAARALNDTVLSVFKLACGAIIGLLGGRTLT